MYKGKVIDGQKHCSKCDTYNTLDYFTRNKKSPDGLHYWCKTCTRANSHNGYFKNKENRIERVAEYRNTPRGKEVVMRAIRKYDNGNPLKKIAHLVVRRALYFNLLNKEDCQICGESKRIHAHHDDYHKPYEVMWLCSQHHKDRHNKLNSLTPKVKKEK